MNHEDLSDDDVKYGRYIDHDEDVCGICGSEIERIGDEYSGYVRCIEPDAMLFHW